MSVLRFIYKGGLFYKKSAVCVRATLSPLNSF